MWEGRKDDFVAMTDGCKLKSEDVANLFLRFRLASFRILDTRTYILTKSPYSSLFPKINQFLLYLENFNQKHKSYILSWIPEVENWVDGIHK